MKIKFALASTVYMQSSFETVLLTRHKGIFKIQFLLEKNTTFKWIICH